MMTSIPGIFACGNVLHVHDLVDNVSKESERRNVRCSLCLGKLDAPEEGQGSLRNIRYVVPQEISLDEPVEFFMRVQAPEEDVTLNVGGIRSKKENSVRPSEMLSIKLTPEQLQSFEGDTFVIEVLSNKEDEVSA